MRRALLPVLAASALLPLIVGVPGLAAAQTAAHRAHAPAPADSVLAWNATAATTVLAAGKFPTEGLIHMSYVQGAVYDAVDAIAGGYQPYVGHLRAPHWASVDAAVAAAAHDVLVTHLPTQRASVDAAYATALAAIPDGKAKTAGIDVGVQAAEQLLAARTGDGLDAPVAYTFGSGPGAWILPTDNTATNAQTPQTPWAATMRPFLIRSASQFRPGPPPDLTSARYAADLNETQAWGSKTSTLRTADQTQIARFWTASGIVPDNEAMRRVTQRLNLGATATARALAMLDMVEADSLIACFDAKYHYAAWRPYTAIRGADTDANPATTADPTWLPLAATPNHPEYPAAHTCVTAAQGDVLASVLGTTTINADISSPVTATTRRYDTVAQLDTEVLNARIWAGLHFRTSLQVGLTLGNRVARAALDDHFQPLH